MLSFETHLSIINIMPKSIIRIATRKSPLAMWQAEHVASSLQSIWPGLEVELVPMQTKGDRFLKDRLQNIGGKGLFIKELETALLNNQADIAVHSMKDVPAEQPAGLQLAVICEREDPHDALLSHGPTTLADFADGAIIGTSSLRREAQILAKYPKLKIKTLRGNIHTRINKLKDKEYDGIILAASGLIRMNLNIEIKATLNKQIMLPACGQGALGIECRSNDHESLKLIEPLNDDSTNLCVRTERKINHALGGSCHSPIGIHCEIINNELQLTVRVLGIDGRQEVNTRLNAQLNDSANMITKALNDLEQQGVRKLLNINLT